MNLNVLAEGVETESQRARLQQMQCHEVRDHYYSAAMSSTKPPPCWAGRREASPGRSIRWQVERAAGTGLPA